MSLFDKLNQLTESVVNSVSGKIYDTPNLQHHKTILLVSKKTYKEVARKMPV